MSLLSGLISQVMAGSKRAPLPGTPSWAPTPPPPSGGISTIFDSQYDPSWRADFARDIKSEPLPAQPARGVIVTDQAYGAKYRRVDKISDSPESATIGFIRHDYSRRNPYNCDSTIRLTNAENGVWYIFDAVTGAKINGGRTSGVGVTGLIGHNGNCEPMWHPTDPKKTWFNDTNGGLIWYEFNIDTKVTTTLFNLTSKVRALGGRWANASRATTRGEGIPSRDGRYWALLVATDAFDWIGVITYDRQLDVLTGYMETPSSHPPDHVSITPSGQWVILSAGVGPTVAATMEEDHARDLTQWCGVRRYPRDFSSHVTLSVKGEHSDICRGPNDEEYFVWVSFYGPREYVTDGAVSVCDINNPMGVRFSTAMNTFPDEEHLGVSTGTHISGTCIDRPGLAVLSRYEGRGTNPHDWFVGVVELIPNGKVYRLVRNWGKPSDYDSQTEGGRRYSAEPQAAPNRDLTRIIFSSNFAQHDNENTDCEIILPSWGIPPAGSSEPIQATAPTVSGTAVTGGTLTATDGTFTGVPTPTVTGRWESSPDGTTWTDTGVTSLTSPVLGANGTRYSRVTRGQNSNGFLEVRSNIVTVAALSAPSNTVAPSIPSSGYSDTAATIDPGTWSGNPVPSYTYAWERNISGSWVEQSTSRTYTPSTVGSWRGKTTATNTQGTNVAYTNTMTVTLRPVEPVPNQTITFNQANGTALSAITPLAAGGGSARFSVNAAELRDNGNGYASVPAFLTDITGPNQALEVVIKAGRFVGGFEQVNFYLNATSATAGYEIRLTPTQAQVYRNGTYVAGLAHGVNVATTALRAKATSFQGRLRVYINGSTTPLIDDTQAAITTGNGGLMIYASGNVTNIGIESINFYKEA